MQRKQWSRTCTNQEFWFNSTVVGGKQLFIGRFLFSMYTHIKIRITCTIIDLGKLADAKCKCKKKINKNGLIMSCELTWCGQSNEVHVQE